MAQRIEPFHRVSTAHADDPAAHRWAVVTLWVMRAHFTLYGVALLLGAIALGGYLYSLEFERIDVTGDLRITRQGDIYEPDFQVKVLGVLALVGASVLQFYTANLLGQRRRTGLLMARIAALMPLAGLPVGVFLLLLSGGAGGEDAGLVDQVIDELSLAVRVVAAVLVFQSLLAIWYEIAVLLKPLRRYCNFQAPLGNPLLRRIKWFSVAAWLIAIIGLAVLLGVMTDWIYELPVPVPQPGELLYATSFDNFNSEWDLFPGRDSAQVVYSDDLLAKFDVAFDPALADSILVINYGAGGADEVIWSVLDRKFNDFDLRVATRLLDGPMDQNQFGVIFRYRGPENFYIFRMTADGYYSLVKVRDGVQEKISDWGLSDVINQGNAANTLRIVAQGDTFRFFINDAPVPLCLKGPNETSMWANWEGPGICFTDELRYVYEDRAFEQGRIALAAGTIDGSDVTVAFDDLVLIGPDPVALAELETE